MQAGLCRGVVLAEVALETSCHCRGLEISYVLVFVGGDIRNMVVIVEGGGGFVRTGLCRGVVFVEGGIRNKVGHCRGWGVFCKGWSL